ncbi:CDP-glycerol glycerophosphotransferase family protein [Pseudoalteromonas sp. 20-92]|uniref:CDP-glycerol glycerophosphotransferase family protein n=1 Tax=Pseudoalteromonas sp. 20-92 TaxID=2969394 RepID=UPI0027B706FE|nr:CDP-glycerol glycerophosphotransferase family protein [Pseudoalteromonas sp. 20-92]MDQ2044684.1 CDP-glycerol glycerophosphotransferase family protein [Pseudoalteromonas sp. 20-92]
MLNKDLPSLNKTSEFKYLFFVNLSYSFNVLRPIEHEIKKRGGSVAWFIPTGSEAEGFLQPDDYQLLNIKEVKEYNANATLAPGNVIPHFFPGIKVQVFHGFDSGKKNKFNIRGFFDLYCTQGPNITQGFNDINDGTCDVVETGWSKLDPLFTEHKDIALYQSDKPTILYAPTFSPKLTSTYKLYPYIKALLKTQNWQWIVKLHPKATSEEIEMYKSLACENLTFITTGDVIPILQATDIILSDTSSIIIEFALQEKVAVAFNNRKPKDWMINFSNEADLESTLISAFQKDEHTLEKVKQYCDSVHPYRDGKSSVRVLGAINNLICSGTSHLKRKPLNLLRKFKIRKSLNYYWWS